MPDDPYSLTNLARLAGVTPRTVRYYLAQGLLPAAEAAGPATRYSDGHLARLRLIRRLQREHLPLSEIRARLERMGDDDVQATLDTADAGAPAPPQGTVPTLAFVRDLMARAGVSPRFYDRPAQDAPQDAPPAPSPAPAPASAAPGEATPPPASAAPHAPTHRPQPGPMTELSVRPLPASVTARLVPDRTTWERLSITPDVEIHVRRPLDRLSNKRVERLARIARELFEEEP